MGMIGIIKQAGVDAMVATNPTCLIVGEVLSITENIKQIANDNITYHISSDIPELTIKIDQKLTLTREFLIISENVTSYKADLKHYHTCDKNTDEKLGLLSIRTGLKEGDKVILMRVQGGQEYVVLDKVAGNEWS